MNVKQATDQTPAERKSILVQLGPLRVVLALASLVLLVLSPDPGTQPIASGWEMATTLIVPVLAPLVVMVLLLDALMSGVFMVDKTGAERARFRTIAFVDLLLAAALLVFWVPYFLAMT